MSEIFEAKEGHVTAVDGVDYYVTAGEIRSDEYPPVKAVPHLWKPFADPAPEAAPQAVAVPAGPEATESTEAPASEEAVPAEGAGTVEAETPTEVVEEATEGIEVDDSKPEIPAEKPSAYAEVKALAEAHGVDLTGEMNRQRSGADLWADLEKIRGAANAETGTEA